MFPRRSTEGPLALVIFLVFRTMPLPSAAPSPSTCSLFPRISLARFMSCNDGPRFCCTTLKSGGGGQLAAVFSPVAPRAGRGGGCSCGDHCGDHCGGGAAVLNALVPSKPGNQCVAKSTGGAEEDGRSEAACGAVAAFSGSGRCSSWLPKAGGAGRSIARISLNRCLPCIRPLKDRRSGRALRETSFFFSRDIILFYLLKKWSRSTLSHWVTRT
jgi:hypothetical protein